MPGKERYRKHWCSAICLPRTPITLPLSKKGKQVPFMQRAFSRSIFLLLLLAYEGRGPYGKQVINPTMSFKKIPIFRTKQEARLGGEFSQDPETRLQIMQPYPEHRSLNPLNLHMLPTSSVHIERFSPSPSLQKWTSSL